MIKHWEEKVAEKRARVLQGESGTSVRILAIETSCDETSIAIVENGNRILSNVVSSQIEIHKRFGGVVPEVASRKHVEGMNYILDQALQEARLTLNEVDAIAVTYGPGLIGALLVGISAAKAIAFSKGIPLIGVHHIAGHIYANQLVTPMRFPLIALVVSGGHTELVYMENHLHFEVLGETRDDAAGEAYDKVARSLQLSYPGGPQIDRLAQQGQANIPLPRALMDDSFDFSFSGLKSAVVNSLHNAEQRGEEIKKEDMAASFQEAVVDVLVEKTFHAIKEKKVNHLVLAGGVAANSGLRRRLIEKAKLYNVSLTIPPLSLCTDNAAMIGSVGYFAYLQGKWSTLDLNGIASLPLSTF